MQENEIYFNNKNIIMTDKDTVKYKRCTPAPQLLRRLTPRSSKLASEIL